MKAAMSSVRKTGLIAGAMMACSGAASATTITQTLSFGPATTDFSTTLDFDGFDPALGTLTSVQDTITEELSGSVDVTNTGSTSTSYIVFLTNVATATLPGLTVGAVDVSNTAEGVLSAGASSGTLPLSGTASNSDATTSDLAEYEIATVDAAIMDAGSLSLSSSTGNVTANFTDTGEIIDQLVYTYTPTPVTGVPEPGSLTLLGAALVGFGLLRWRKAA